VYITVFVMNRRDEPTMLNRPVMKRPISQ